MKKNNSFYIMDIIKNIKEIISHYDNLYDMINNEINLLKNKLELLLKMFSIKEQNNEILTMINNDIIETNKRIQYLENILKKYEIENDFNKYVVYY